MITTFLTIDDLTKRYRLNAKTIYNLAKSGKLPSPLRIGHSVRWRLSDIETFETKGCVENG